MSVQTIEGVFSQSFAINPYRLIALENIKCLTRYLKAEFFFAALDYRDGTYVGDGTIKPPFLAAVYGQQDVMDKLPLRGKGGQAPFAQVGMRYGGENGRHFVNRQFIK